MNHLRQASLLLVGGLFVSLIVPSCKAGDDDPAAEECPRGDQGCRCKTNDTCNSGLTCSDAGKCVAGAGQGGSASAATGGSSGRASGGRAGTEAFAPRGGSSGTQGRGTGGTTADAGAGGDPGTGGVVGSGGSGNATGQAGDGAAAGESGAPGSGGTGGSGTGGTGGGTGGSGAAGKGGTAGVGGSPPCTAITTTALEIHLSDNNANYASVFTPSQGTAGDDDLIALQLYEGVIFEMNYHGADVGTFELGTGEDANYSTCSRCLVGGINGSEKWFLATEGTLTFELDSKHMNASPHGTLRNVVLREATFAEDTFVSTFVPGGECLTLANGDLLVNSDEPPWTCDPGFYDDDGDFCDCGCGGHDPDCASANISVCEYCYCNPNDDMDCSAVNSTQNRSCNL